MRFNLKWSLRIIGLIITFFLVKLLYVGGVFKSITNFNSGTVAQIFTNMPGTEDLAYDGKIHTLFISSTNRWAITLKHQNTKDGIYGLNLEDSMAVPKKILTTFSGDFHPHGISVLRQRDTLYLFAVNHNSKGSFIEKFRYQNGTLIHLSSYHSTLLFSPNDVAAVTDSTFYVTNDHGYKPGFKQTLENYLQLPKSYVLYFNGARYKTVADGFKYANGVTLSDDNTKVYVATSTGQKLYVYHRQINGDLTLQQTVSTGFGNDNITVDRNGDLWIAGHPKLLQFTAHAKDSTKISASEVMTLHRQADGHYLQKVVYLNDGSQISATSVALTVNRWLYVGDVFQHKLLKIKLND